MAAANDSIVWNVKVLESLDPGVGKALREWLDKPNGLDESLHSLMDRVPRKKNEWDNTPLVIVYGNPELALLVTKLKELQGICDDLFTSIASDE